MLDARASYLNQNTPRVLAGTAVPHPRPRYPSTQRTDHVHASVHIQHDASIASMLLQWCTLEPAGASSLAAIRFTSPVRIQSISIFPTSDKPFEQDPSIVRYVHRAVQQRV